MLPAEINASSSLSSSSSSSSSSSVISSIPKQQRMPEKGKLIPRLATNGVFKKITLEIDKKNKSDQSTTKASSQSESDIDVIYSNFKNRKECFSLMRTNLIEQTIVPSNPGFMRNAFLVGGVRKLYYVKTITGFAFDRLPFEVNPEDAIIKIKYLLKKNPYLKMTYAAYNRFGIVAICQNLIEMNVQLYSAISIKRKHVTSLNYLSPICAKISEDRKTIQAHSYCPYTEFTGYKISRDLIIFRINHEFAKVLHIPL